MEAVAGKGRERACKHSAGSGKMEAVAGKGRERACKHFFNDTLLPTISKFLDN